MQYPPGYTPPQAPAQQQVPPGYQQPPQHPPAPAYNTGPGYVQPPQPQGYGPPQPPVPQGPPPGMFTGVNNAAVDERYPKQADGSTVDSSIDRIHWFPSADPNKPGMSFFAVEMTSLGGNDPALPPGTKHAWRQNMANAKAKGAVKGLILAALGLRDGTPEASAFDADAASQGAIGTLNPMGGGRYRVRSFGEQITTKNNFPFLKVTFSPYKEGAPFPRLGSNAAPAPAAAAPQGPAPVAAAPQGPMPAAPQQPQQGGGYPFPTWISDTGVVWRTDTMVVVHDPNAPPR